MADLGGECFEQVSDHLQAACDLIARCWGAKSWPVRRRGDRIGNREAERLGCLGDGRPQGAAVTFPFALKAAHFKFARWPRELMRLAHCLPIKAPRYQLRAWLQCRGTRGYDQ